MARDARNSPNLRHLQAALAIKRLGSISQAAKRIHLSQSAITQALGKLERNLGEELFLRSSKGLLTTEVGEIFLARVERAQGWLKALENALISRPQARQINVVRSLTTTQLRAFVAVVEHRSYSLAANQLSVTQPTVHRAVSELETVCEQTFFQRSPSGVEPTWLARQMARYASLYFSELAQGMDEVSEYAGQMTGSIRIGSLPLARTRMVPHAVTSLLKEFPEATVSIIDGPYEEQLHSLLHGQLDIIVGALRERPPSPEIIQQHLFSDPLHIVVRPDHPLAQRPAHSAEELRELDWIAPGINTPARAAFTSFFENEGLDPPAHVVECSSLVAIRGLLLESNRAALLPARQVAVEVDHGLLAVSPQHLTGTSRNIGLTRRKDWIPTQIQSRFIELIKTV